MVIYADVLIVINIYINWLLLLSCARLSGVRVKSRRILLASIAGALFSLSVLLPPFGAVATIAYKLVCAAVTAFICFGRKSFIKRLAIFFVCSFLFAGAALGFFLMFEPKGLLVSNGSVYFDISFGLLFIFTSVSYLIVCAVKYIFDRSLSKNGRYSVLIKNSGKCVSLCGIADTGNALVDGFSGKPVIVCGKSDFGFDLDLFCDDVPCPLPGGLRYVPVQTIGGSGTIAVFRPQEVCITDINSGKTKSVDALIGLGENGGTAVFNPTLLV